MIKNKHWEYQASKGEHSPLPCMTALTGDDKIGYLGFGVLDLSHDASNGVLHVGVLYYTGSLATLVEPVGYEEIWHMSHLP